MNILDKIVADKRLEIQRHKEAYTVDMLLESERMAREPVSMSRALATSPSGIIAEFKRKSPSKGWIHRDADPETVVAAYQQGGASASSVLTDLPYFGGTAADLCKVRKNVTMPLLRKEFIIDEYQIYQAKAIGADAILLIAAILDRKTCRRFTESAHSLGLEVLLELHGENELDYMDAGADMVGINNRDLTTFETRVEHSFDMISRLPSAGIYISESGISSPDTVIDLRQAGFRGFLMGENFMKEEQPGKALGEFIQRLNGQKDVN